MLGRSATLVPLVAHGRDVGVLSLGWRDAGRRPARDEWSLVEALAQRIALAVDGALQYRERAHVAQTLQASLLPAALPDIPGATVAAQYVASGEGMDVGGDFYDVFALDDGSWILVIGDVLGKGAEAAAVTALARYTVRAVAGRSPSPAATLAALNDEMLRQRNPDRRFVTAVLARLEPHADGGARLVVASGGHPPPVLLRAGGDAEVVPCPGTLLGVEHDARSFDQEIELGPGDTLVLYTDGVTEARRDHPLTPRGPRRRAARQRPRRRGRGGARGRAPRRGRRGRRACATTSRCSSWPSTRPAELDLPAALGRRARGLERALELAQGAGQRGGQLVAGVGQAHRPARAMGQHDAELVLEAPDVAAERGLRDAEAHGGAPEVQLGGEHLERAQVAQVHHRARQPTDADSASEAVVTRH